MELVRAAADLRATTGAARRSGRRVALVPTMGALHAGHLSLLAAARTRADVVVASIFVNPLQFGSATDLEHYPRDLATDLRLAGDAGVDVVFAPPVAEVFPGGVPPGTVDAGPLGTVLEGASRPGHFDGVATVVARLFELAGPCIALFGEKDFQQLAVVRSLVERLEIAVEILGCATIRDADGLACSSRNERLSPTDREQATVLFRALRSGRDALAGGELDPRAISGAIRDVVDEKPDVSLDYAAVIDPATFEVPTRIDPGDRAMTELRLLIAAQVGPVRLIDNLAALVPVPVRLPMPAQPLVRRRVASAAAGPR